eukprot:6173732-Pleurochrysis_carterae.AAC.1
MEQTRARGKLANCNLQATGNQWSSFPAERNVSSAVVEDAVQQLIMCLLILPATALPGCLCGLGRAPRNVHATQQLQS